MNKIVLALVILTTLLVKKYPEDIIGKWIVKSVWVGDKSVVVPLSSDNFKLLHATENYRNATLEFRVDHNVIINTKSPSRVKKGRWEYNSNSGIVKIVNQQDGKAITTLFNAEYKDGDVVFSLPNSPFNLRLNKK